ncbi:TrkA-N domain protein (fragment) [Desulfamplus magnetovallimortis]|uniref:TrkA-N domain protein n=1 Tax=Desulfamplus magnetovallimortis TaxID=1246637 RepID=A0A1W1H514_9BACT
MDNQIKKLDAHYIVCGYGRIGRLLTQYLVQKYIDVVVVEKESNHEDKLDEDGVLYLIGEAADDNMLIRAGIKKASGIIAGVGKDEENVLLVQLARKLNPDIFIVARASRDSSRKMLEEAGANKVISPYDIGARRIAHAILRPTVIKFLETAFNDDSTEFQFEEVHVRQGSKLDNVSLVDSGIRQKMNLIVIAIQDKEGKMIFNPEANTKFKSGDTVVVMGSAKSIKEFENLIR